MLNTYKYLTYENRLQLSQMYTNGKSSMEIATALGVHVATIYLEIKRGYTGEVDENNRPVYSAEKAEAQTRENVKRKGRYQRKPRQEPDQPEL